MAGRLMEVQAEDSDPKDHRHEQIAAMVHTEARVPDSKDQKEVHDELEVVDDVPSVLPVLDLTTRHSRQYGFETEKA